MSRKSVSKNDFLVSDGGVTSYLYSEYIKDESLHDKNLWGAEAVITNPDALKSVHRDYVKAGADIITACTYQASTEKLKEKFGTQFDVDDYYRKAVALAREVIEEEAGSRRILVAGSVGPYGASLGDGSEYTGSYIDNVTQETLENFNKDKIFGLVNAGADILAIETIPCVKEILAILNVVERTRNAQCWVSFQCNEDGKSTARGEPFQKAVEAVFNHNATKNEKVIAISVNCVKPNSVTKLLKAANTVNFTGSKRIPYVVYSNSGEGYDGVTKGWNGQSEEDIILELIPEWISLGANIIGGCCQIWPAKIREIKEKFTLCLLQSLKTRMKLGLCFDPEEEDVEKKLKKKEIKTRKNHNKNEAIDEDEAYAMKNLLPGHVSQHEIDIRFRENLKILKK